MKVDLVVIVTFVLFISCNIKVNFLEKFIIIRLQCIWQKMAKYNMFIFSVGEIQNFAILCISQVTAVL